MNISWGLVEGKTFDLKLILNYESEMGRKMTGIWIDFFRWLHHLCNSPFDLALNLVILRNSMHDVWSYSSMQIEEKDTEYVDDDLDFRALEDGFVS